MTKTTETGVALARLVLVEGIYDERGRLRGMDAFTASAIMTVYDALKSERNRQTYAAKSPRTAAAIAWKLVK